MLELSPDIHVRCKEKLKLIDNVEKQSYHLKLTNLPRLTKSDITTYFTKAYKSLESYKYYESKYVRERNVCEILRSSEVNHGHCTACTKRRFSELLDRDSVFMLTLISSLVGPVHKGF
jgi:hypothetical protein